jgi:hypothetical protein
MGTLGGWLGRPVLPIDAVCVDPTVDDGGEIGGWMGKEVRIVHERWCFWCLPKPTTGPAFITTTLRKFPCPSFWGGEEISFKNGNFCQKEGEVLIKGRKSPLSPYNAWNVHSVWWL